MDMELKVNLGLSKRYKIRRYKIQDIENVSLRKGFYISCIFVSCNLYLTEKLQFEDHSPATLLIPAATKGARIIPQTPKSLSPAYMDSRERRG